jgi:3-hydroxy-9,10-secoandrosta-1,3,5(10)-triene-9,17-dione monooxygenase reductase component
VIFVGEVLAYDRSDEPPLVYQAGQYAIAARKPRQEVRLGATPPPECSYTEDLLGYLLGRSHYQMLFALRRLLASHALDEPAFFILSTLSVRDRLTLEELNAIIGYTGFTVTPPSWPPGSPALHRPGGRRRSAAFRADRRRPRGLPAPDRARQGCRGRPGG